VDGFFAGKRYLIHDRDPLYDLFEVRFWTFPALFVTPIVSLFLASIP
jgi:hypothetical protein